MADAERGQDHRCLRDLLEQWGVQETLTEGMLEAEQLQPAQLQQGMCLGMARED